MCYSLVSSSSFIIRVLLFLFCVCVCAFQLLCKFLHHVAGAQMLVKQPCIAVTALIAIIALYIYIYTFFLRPQQSFRCVYLILPKEHMYISIFSLAHWFLLLLFFMLSS